MLEIRVEKETLSRRLDGGAAFSSLWLEEELERPSSSSSSIIVSVYEVRLGRSF